MLFLILLFSFSVHAISPLENSPKSSNLHASTDYLGPIEYIPPQISVENAYSISGDCLLIPSKNDADALLKLFNQKFSTMGDGYVLHAYSEDMDPDSLISDEIFELEPYESFIFSNGVKDGYGPMIVSEHGNFSAGDRVFYITPRQKPQQIIGAIVFYVYFRNGKVYTIISGLNIDANYRKQGLGETLFQFAVCTSVLHGSAKIELEYTDVSLNTYKKNGFKKRDTANHYLYFNWYLDGEEFYSRLESNIKEIARFDLKAKFVEVSTLFGKFSRGLDGGWITPDELALLQKHVDIPAHLDEILVSHLNSRLQANPIFYLGKRVRKAQASK